MSLEIEERKMGNKMKANFEFHQRVLCPILALLFTIGVTACGESVVGENAAPAKESYEQDTVLKEVNGFFGESAEDLAEVVSKVFSDHGRPNALIMGSEISIAAIIGLRYGDGTLVMNDGTTRDVHWTGPSVGFDAGGNASKVFILVYNLESEDDLFQRFPGVEGSLYAVGGVSMNYQRKDNIVFAPIRVGVGWRAGINVGYVKYTEKKTASPF